MTLKRIDPISLGNIFALMTTIAFLINIIFLSFSKITPDFILSLSALDYGPRIILVIVSLFIVWICGLISGSLIANLYNLTAKLVGGIKLELELELE